MNKVLRTTLTFCLACVGLMSNAQTDISSIVLTNAGFDDDSSWTTEDVAGQSGANSKAVAGWTATGASWCASAAFGYNTEGKIAGYQVPAINPDGGANGGALGVSGAWGGTVTYSQNVTLPAGTYFISFKAMNLYADATYMVAKILLNGAEVKVTEGFTYNSWETNTANFTLEEDVEDVPLTLSFTGKSDVGSAGSAKIFVDGVVISTETVSAIKTLIEQPIYDAVIARYNTDIADWRAKNVQISELDAQYPGFVSTDDVQEKMNQANLKLTQAKNNITDAYNSEEANATSAVKDACNTLLAEAEDLISAALADAQTNLTNHKISLAMPAAGEYLLQTTFNDKTYYLAPSNSWGTQASLTKESVAWKLAKIDLGVYTLESVVSQGDNHYFNGTYCDAPIENVFFNWNEADGTITFSTPNAANYIVVTNESGDAKNPVVGNTGDLASALKWTFVPTAVDNIKKYADVTYLIKDANFGRNNRERAAWTNTNVDLSGNGGGSDNGPGHAVHCSEAYHKVFSLSQEIENVPNGYYTMTVYGFYRQDGTDNENLPVFFINGTEETFPVLSGTENNMYQAGGSFASGNYAVKIPVNVTDGKIKLGAELKENTLLWCIFDNFGLVYMGDDASEYVTFHNNRAYAEINAAFAAAEAAFAAANDAVDNYDAFVQTAVAEKRAAIAKSLQHDNDTEDVQKKDDQGNPMVDEVTGDPIMETVTISDYLWPRIVAANTAETCVENKDAFLAEIAAIAEAITAYATEAQTFQTENADAYAAMTQACTDLVAEWQDAFDKINTEYKEYINGNVEAYNGYLKTLNSTYVKIDPLQAQIDAFNVAGTCKANKDAKLEEMAGYSTTVKGVVDEALTSYQTDVTTANDAAYKAVTDKAAELEASYKAAIVKVSGHYTALHKASADAAQTALFEIYTNIQNVKKAANTAYNGENGIVKTNATRFAERNFPLAYFENADYLQDLEDIGTDDIDAIVDALETEAAADHATKLATYTATYENLLTACEALQAKIVGYELTAANYATEISAIEAALATIQPYLFAPVNNPLTMTITRRQADNDHITKWSVYGSNVADAADADWEKVADINTPFGNNTETLSRSFANTKNFQYLRFYIDETAPRGKFFGHMSEFQLYAGNTALITDVAQLSSPYTQAGDGQGLPALIDGDAATYWHSQWSPEPAAAHTHYLQVALPEATHALGHSYVEASDSWNCALVSASSIEEQLTAIQNKITALDEKATADRNSNLLAQVQEKTGAANEALKAAIADDYADEVKTKYAEIKAAIGAKIDALDEQAEAADEAGTLIAKFNDIIAKIGNVNDVPATEPEAIEVATPVNPDTKAAAAEVNGIDGIKAGTGSVAGSATIVVPAGVKNVTFNALAWKDKTDVTLSISDGSANDPVEYTIQGDDGITGNSPFTVADVTGTDYVYTFETITTGEVTLTLSASDNRFVIWNVKGNDGVIADPTIYAEINALTATAANENIKVGMDVAIATLTTNNNNAAAVCAEIGQVYDQAGVSALITNLATVTAGYYDAVTLAEHNEIVDRVVEIQAEIDGNLSVAYLTDLSADLDVLKNKWNLAYADPSLVDDEFNFDETRDLIAGIEGDIAALNNVCNAAQYATIAAEIANLDNIFEDYAQWIEDNILLGDANLNGEVTISDAVVAISFALDDTKVAENDRQAYALDVNKDSKYTISDAVAIINIALGLNDEAASVKGVFEVNNDYLTFNRNEISLINEKDYVAFQMDITLAKGASFDGIELGARANQLSVYTHRINENTVRVIALSMDNSAIDGNDGSLLTVLTNGQVNVANVQFVDATARAYTFAGTLTGLDRLNAELQGADIYTVGGTRVNKVQKGINVVRQADGSVKKVLVK